MKKASKHLSTIVFLIFIFSVSVLFIALPKKEYSENEKRYLTQFPTLTVESFFSCDFGVDFEKYLSDHMPFRTFFVGLNSYYNNALGNPLSNGIYNCKDGYLINDPPTYERLDINFSIVADFAKENDIKTSMVLAPSTGYVCSDLLPNKHIIYKDDEYFEKAQKVLSEADVDFIDMRKPLKKAYNNGTQVFYKTDHHWTAQGAYLAYSELADTLGYEKNEKENYDITQYENFFGTTYSSSGFWLTKPDVIETWESKNIKETEVSVEITEGEEVTTSDSMFYLEHLKENDKYPVYLDGNHPYTTITNSSLSKEKDSKKLLIIKDSFAHTLTPFLADHYAEITMIDMRYYKQNVTELLKKGDFDNVLFVYSIDNLSTDSDLAFILD